MQKIDKIDGRLLPEEIGSETSVVNLFFTKPDMKIPIIEINVTTSEVQLEVYYFSTSILGTIDEIESQNLPFTDIPVGRIMRDYKHLNPCIKEGILHSFRTDGESNRTASRSLVVKYRMFDRMYKAHEYYQYDINEDEIAESVLPYIISMRDIYSRIYPMS
jgi:hypothetical protein